MSTYRSKNGKIIQLTANERFLAHFYRFVTFICRLFLTFPHEFLHFIRNRIFLFIKKFFIGLRRVYGILNSLLGLLTDFNGN